MMNTSLETEELAVKAAPSQIKNSETPTETKKAPAKKDSEIIFSKCIRAGKRIYYLDAKKNRKGEMYLSITESKKQKHSNTDANCPPQFEKHKIFLFEEDFDNFIEGMDIVTDYIRKAVVKHRGDMLFKKMKIKEQE